MAIATFGAGCFWGVEAAFRRIDGVVGTSAGYSGGTTADPSYEEVCTGRTGHAEVVRVEFDAERVSYDELLELFWNIHDPTQLDRQGPDIGSQYRSAIFFDSKDQEKAARASFKRQNKERFAGAIVTEITPAADFYLAEDYHQQYAEKRARAALGLQQVE